MVIIPSKITKLVSLDLFILYFLNDVERYSIPHEVLKVYYGIINYAETEKVLKIKVFIPSIIFMVKKKSKKLSY